MGDRVRNFKKKRARSYPPFGMWLQFGKGRNAPITSESILRRISPSFASVIKKLVCYYAGYKRNLKRGEIT